MLKTAVRRVGNSLGITLPKTIVDNYHLNEGDELHLVETDEGVVLTPFNPKFAKWAKAYERTNRKYRNTLKTLARLNQPDIGLAGDVVRQARPNYPGGRAK